MTTTAPMPWAAARFAFDGVIAAAAVRTANARHGRPARLVVAVDGSPASVRALRWVAGVGPRLDCTVELVDVVGAFEWVFEPDGDNPVRDARDGIAELVREVFGLVPPHLLHVDVEHADPVTRLVELSRDADLLVVGSRQREDGVAVPDSVGLRVAGLASCPVLVVH